MAEVLTSFAGVDCDVHPTVPGMHSLLPYLDDHWRESVIEREVA